MEEVIDENILARKISKEIGMPYEQTLSIIRSSIGYIIHVMKYSGFEAVKLPYLGKFMVKPKRLQYYNEKKIRRKSGSI
jgi:hypothetical protein